MMRGARWGMTGNIPDGDDPPPRWVDRPRGRQGAAAGEGVAAGLDPFRLTVRCGRSGRRSASVSQTEGLGGAVPAVPFGGGRADPRRPLTWDRAKAISGKNVSIVMSEDEERNKPALKERANSWKPNHLWTFGVGGRMCIEPRGVVPWIYE